VNSSGINLVQRSIAAALFVLTLPGAASAADALVVSGWGGAWKDLIATTVGNKFTEETGIPVEIVTGGTMDRLAKAKFAGADPETDITLTTEHVAWMYASDNLLAKPDMAKMPNTKTLFPAAVTGSGCLGLFSYVYSIVYRTDLLPSASFASWRDLWKPEYKNMIGMPDFDPSHIITVSAKLSDASVQDWKKGGDLLQKLRPNVKAFYSTDAASQEMMARGDTPVEIMLSGNYYYLKDNGVAVAMAIPKEGAIAGVNCIGINAGTKKMDAALKFIDIAFRPEIQGALAKAMKLGPMTSNAQVPADIAALPGILTTTEQWSKTIVIDPKQRAALLPEWRTWFTENMVRK
jgi:putative spermidine/putrescine transport system substrate-binding protein